jgi:ferredoxin-NADP reductase/predicted lipid-binding transport protein (Tim44 family)
MLNRTCRGVPRTARWVAFYAAIILLAVGPAMVDAQMSPEEHASHHPGESEPTPAASQPDAGPNGPKGAGGGGGMGGGGGGMGGMMQQMGAPKPKQLYPSLMALPDLPMEKRQEVQREAHERMKAGAALMSQGLDDLSRAAPSDDYQAMQKATAAVREGISQFDSGLAAHRALAEGKAPRDVALRWFKREMNLLPPGGGGVGEGPFGLPWVHLLIMLVLVLFAAAMIVMYFFKMRRAAALLANLTKTSAAAPPAGPTGSSTKAAEPSAEKQPAPSPAPPTALGAAAGATPATASDCCDDTAEACESEESPGATGASGGLLPFATKKKLCHLKVARIDRETPDVKTFRLVSCHGGGIPFSYLPGQFLTLTLPVGETPIRRSYTISSPPTQGYYCEVTVKREDRGAGSRYLHDRVKVGDILEVKAPSGKFVFTGEEADGVVLIGGGVGITPMRSIARALTDMAWPGEIYLIAACQDPEHFIFESELKQLESRYENLHLFAAMSRIEKDMGPYRRGRLSKEMLAQWVPDIGSKWIHLCGAPPVMDAVKQLLAELNVPADRIHTENFGSAQKPKAKTAEAPRAAPAEAAGNGAVTFTASDVSTELYPDETVLEASERVGVDIDYSCRVGACGECKVKLLSGEVAMETEDGLDPGEKERGIILACQAKSKGDIAVDA